MGLTQEVERNGAGGRPRRSRCSRVRTSRTTLAVVGACVLAVELAKTADHGEAFRSCGRLVRPFVEQGQGVSETGHCWTHPHTLSGIAIQRASLSVLSKPGIRDAIIAAMMRNPDDIDLPKCDFEARRARGPERMAG